MIIREIKISDAEKLANLTQQVEGNSEYMLWEAGERNVQIEQQIKMIKSIEQKENSTILVAEKDNDELVGFLLVMGGMLREINTLLILLLEFYRIIEGKE
ncbi:hypothetical protein [Oceanobacillus chungangensis]|uniref:hypothetical protein n=1 Tax=Oceanobacillus chungangensis TaxID=1229152 RepID=UPI00268C935C